MAQENGRKGNNYGIIHIRLKFHKYSFIELEKTLQGREINKEGK